MSLCCFHNHAYFSFILVYSLCCACFYVALFLSYPCLFILLLSSYIYTECLLHFHTYLYYKREFKLANHEALCMKMNTSCENKIPHNDEGGSVFATNVLFEDAKEWHICIQHFNTLYYKQAQKICTQDIN